MAPKYSYKLINTKDNLSNMETFLFALGLEYARLDEKTNDIISEVPVMPSDINSARIPDSLYDNLESLSVSLLYWKIIKNDPEREKLSVINVIQTTIVTNGYLYIHYNNALTDDLWSIICDSTLELLKKCTCC